MKQKKVTFEDVYNALLNIEKCVDKAIEQLKELE